MERIVKNSRHFIGGQVEIRNGVSKYAFRGEIKEVKFNGTDLVIDLAWVAAWTNFPHTPCRWVKLSGANTISSHVIGLSTHTVSNLGENQIRLLCSTNMQVTTLFSKGDRTNLSRNDIEGL